jgi:hypothetical protein
VLPSLQGQQRTLTRTFDKMLGTEGSIRMCDRTALILDIFAQRAATHEGQLQVSGPPVVEPLLGTVFIHMQASTLVCLLSFLSGNT